MTKSNGVNLDSFMENFIQLEQTMADVNYRNNMLEVMLADANRLLKYNMAKGKSLVEERDGLLVTVDKLQQSLQEQCHLRVQNEKLNKNLLHLKQQNEQATKDRDAHIRRLVDESKAEEERQQRELESLRQQCRKELQDLHREGLNQLEAKDLEVKMLLEAKDWDLEEMKKRLKDQEKEKQSQLLKIQMEFGAKLARVQSSAQRGQQLQQQGGPSLLPQSVYKKKLHFFQEEKNKEIEALRQRIKELEEGQRACSVSDGRLKRRKI
ncbi:coiled-coil domain-containing protein 152 [Nelusetta ayraudi]|uniref:coiled-coil domain-containing protein 152 n=1 Tax=Nelusetta ayraudi TaxID=303726 RepID=UPI003F71BCB6